MSGNLLNVITDFLYQRKQRVVLNGQHLSWTNVQAGVPRDLFLDHYSFWSISMTYDLTSNPQLLVDDTSPFSVVQNINSKYKLNSKRSEQWLNENKWLGFSVKMRFNPNPKKQAQEVIFRRKINKIPRYILMAT